MPGLIEPLAFAQLAGTLGDGGLALEDVSRGVLP